MWLPCALSLMVAGADGPSRLREALTLEQAGDDKAALARVEGLIRERPDWELARLEAARLRLKTGTELDLAQLHLEAARALAPENPRGHFLWGLLMEERGLHADAARALELAVLYRADYDDARFRLAGIYFAQGEWAKAEEHYRMLAREHPESTPARLQLAAVLEKQGKLEDTEIELRKLLDSQPRSPVAGRQLAEFYDRTGRPKLAAKVRKAIDKPPKKKKMRDLRKSKR
jgi:tetratricopeptide (TPR) repeat protein